MLGRVSLTLPASAAAVQIAKDLACSFADQAGFAREDRLRIQTLVGLIIRFSVEQSYEGRGGGDVELELELEPGGVTIIACDWGKPMRQTGGADGPMPAGLEDTERLGRDARLINLANDGKRIVVHVDAVHTTIVVANPPDTSPRADVGDRLIVRDAEPEDAERISNLLWRGYSLLYVHHSFYSPRWLEQALASGQVRSTLAEVDGELVGHHALINAAPDRAAETGVAVIDRAWRGLGLFDRLFERTVQRAVEAGLPAIFGRATCAHMFSQKSEIKQGYRASAIVLAGAPAAMAQAQLAADAPSPNRGGLAIYVRPLVATPNRPVFLPERYAEELTRIADHIGIRIVAPQDAIVALETTYTSMVDEEDGTARLRISGDADNPGVAVDRMLRSEGARKADVVYADLDLTQPCEGTIDALRRNGFSLAGLLHAGHGGRDWLRLQRPQVAYELNELQIADEVGQWLLGRVQADLADVNAG